MKRFLTVWAALSLSFASVARGHRAGREARDGIQGGAR
jgi:hypothetical protein